MGLETRLLGPRLLQISQKAMTLSFPNLLLHTPAKSVVFSPDSVASLLEAHSEAVQEGGRKLFGVRVRLSLAQAFAEQVESSRLLWIANHDKRYVDLVSWDDPTLLHECLHTMYNKLFHLALFRLFPQDPEVILAFSMLGATLASLTYGGVSIRKEADGSILPYALLPSRDDPDQSGLVIFEGAVFNEDIPRVVLELLFWLSAERCQVATAIKIIMTAGAPKMIAFAVESTAEGPLFHVPKSFGSGTGYTSKDAEEFEFALSARLLLDRTSYGTSHAELIRTARLKLPLWYFRETTYRHLGLDPSLHDPQSDDGFKQAEEAILDLIESEAAHGRVVHYSESYRRGTRGSAAALDLVQLA